MKISYNWLKWYIPEAPEAEKLADILTYHVAEVESIEKKKMVQEEDWVFDIKILPNRAHDLLSHQGVAREIASLLNIKFVDPTPKYKVPKISSSSENASAQDLLLRNVDHSHKHISEKLKITVQSEKCRRYMGRIVRNIKVGSSPEWVVKHLESIGQRSINNIVDAANLVMFDCGQPIHCFDLDKIQREKPEIIIREAKDGEKMATLDNKQVKLTSNNMVIADPDHVLAIAGVKGGKVAEVDINTKNIIIEVANFDPTSVRKTAKSVSILTDAVKRYENDLSPELCAFAMRELCGLFVEYGFTDFEEIVDVYNKKPEQKKLKFRTEKISKILGIPLEDKEIEDILKKYVFEYVHKKGEFEIEIPSLRGDLEIEEDMAEEIGRIIGYKKVEPKIPEINFQPKVNETYIKISWAKNKLLSKGYSEVMTYTFTSKGEVEVMESASDKKFLRNNLSDGLKESLKLNKLNSSLMGLDEVKIFEIGTVFGKSGEEIHVAYNEKEKIIEKKLEDFCKDIPSDFLFSTLNFQLSDKRFTPWSKFPFIVRDISIVTLPEVSIEEREKLIKNNLSKRLLRYRTFDTYEISNSDTSTTTRLVFQSSETTLTDDQVNQEMDTLNKKVREQGWQVR